MITVGALIAAVLTLIAALLLISQLGFPLWILLAPGVAVLLCVGYGAVWRFAKP